MKRNQNSPGAASQRNGNEIVITGISGCFPNAEDTKKLSENLYNKVDMVTKNDGLYGSRHPELPQYSGTIKGLELFDAPFFRVPHWQAESFEPLGRKLMEQAYTCIFDAGVNPESLKGTKLGVYIGSLQCDNSHLSLYNIFKHNRFIASGCNKAMLANRISYWIDSKGPSFELDCGCASSMACLELAYNRMKTGEIDSALVGGCNQCFLPIPTLNMKRHGLLCLDGKTKCFDKNGDGYVRSDAINIYFLQKAKDARRIYAEVYHVKGKFLSNPDALYLPLRSSEELEKFFDEFYSEIDVCAKQVEYVEANATGIAEADGQELKAIANIFGKDKCIKVGSIKSNMGHTEAASGACAVTKMCLAYQNGQISGNLHYNKPQNHIRAVRNGRVQVVTENTPFDMGFTAINNFSYTGASFHVLLKGHYKSKDKDRYKSSIPRLVLVSGRQDDCVNKILDILESNPVDPEQIALLNNIFKKDIPGHTGRGYTIIDTNENEETVRILRSFKFYSGTTRPLWFLYSGMGSQWAGMGAQLLCIPIFEAAIYKCHKVLETKGLNLIQIITDTDSKIFDNILHSIIGITAIQIGLTDVLTAIGIIPDNVIGHSVGELGSAYADGSLTAEETILSSYSRGLISQQTKFIKGKMAAIGLGHKDVSQILPPEIDMACHNSSTSTTISGPADIVTEFVKSLTEESIFAREVATSNISFHSRYMAKAGNELLSHMRQFVKNPKKRSKKWISTCYLPEQWDDPACQYASSEYFTQNLLNPVYFEEAASMIPKDAIIVEIAPHGLMQAIVKRSHVECMNLSLTRKGEKDSVGLLLNSIGTLYQAGLNPDVDILYPKVEFPVSTKTPVLTNFVAWEHSTKWFTNEYSFEEPKITTAKEFIMTIHDDEYAFLKGHTRNDAIVLPEAAVLVFVWDTLATYKGVEYKDLSVVFENVSFTGEVKIKPEEVIKINIAIQKGCDSFEVTQGNNVIANGVIHAIKKQRNKLNEVDFNITERHLDESDIYTLFNIRGQTYEHEFRSISTTNIERNKAAIKWTGNWITFIDSIMQFSMLSRNNDGGSSVKMINRLSIDVKEHKNRKTSNIKGVPCYNSEILNEQSVVICGGVIVRNIILMDIPKLENLWPSLQTRQFLPHFPSHDLTMNVALQTILQIVSENITNDVIKIKEIKMPFNEASDQTMEQLKELSFLSTELKTILIDVGSATFDEREIVNDNVLIVYNFLSYGKLSKRIIDAMSEKTFILAIEERGTEFTSITRMKAVSVMHCGKKTIVLLKKSNGQDIYNLTFITIKDAKTLSAYNLGNETKNKNVILAMTTSYDCDPQGRIIAELKPYDNVSLVITSSGAPTFDTNKYYYEEQLDKGLKVNILRNGQWGGYYCVCNNFTSSKQSIKLTTTSPGNFKDLAWIEAPSHSNKETVQVHFAGLSMKGCKIALGANRNENFGMDFSGTDNMGKRVMGLIQEDALASTVEADHDLLWPVPKHWSLEEAATVPLPYVLAYYCLTIRSRLYKNRTVFVSCGAGALGQALISVCLSLGCKVFTSVNDVEKKRFLLKLFPELDDHNIGYSNDVDFLNMVKAKTNNKRCDIVISCCSGNTRQAATKYVGFMKHFLDLNESGQEENQAFKMSSVDEDKSYKSVRLSTIFLKEFSKHKMALQNMLSEGIARGTVKPLTSVYYAPMDISRAFNLLHSRKNRCRVLINMKDPLILKDNIKILPRITLHSRKVYIVVCDGSELGIELIDLLIQRGARKLVIHVKPKQMGGYFHLKLSLWKKLDISIDFNTDDLQVKTGCNKLLQGAAKTGSIDGIFITQSYLPKENNIIIKQNDIMDISIVTANMDLTSRSNSDLSYFAVIILSSHNLSNSTVFAEIEKLCNTRYEIGLPSLVLRHDSLQQQTKPYSLSTIFNALETSFKLNYANVTITDAIDDSEEIQKKTKLSTNFNSELGAFLNHILEDEYTATEPIIQMKTKVCSGYEHELLMDTDDTYLLMIPGIGGDHTIFTAVSERLKKPALTLQLAPNLDGSILEMAKKLLDFTRKRIQLKSKFYILGYSFGVNVALELANLLEKEGLVGVVYCLDSSPDALRAHFNAYLGNLTEQQLENSLIKHTYQILTGQDSPELTEELLKVKSWSQKIEVFITNVKNKVVHTHEYLKSFLETIYQRFEMAKYYEPNFKLESELVLMKGIPHPDAETLAGDYNLSKYTKKTVNIFNLDSDHRFVPYDCRVSNFINRTFNTQC